MWPTRQVLDSLLAPFAAAPAIPLSQRLTQRTALLPRGTATRLACPAFNPKDPNATAHVSFYVGKDSAWTDAMTALLV